SRNQKSFHRISMLAPSQVLKSRETSATNGCRLATLIKSTVLAITLAGATLVIFWPVLRGLTYFSLSSAVYSYIPLIPLITLFWIFDARRRIFLDSKCDFRLGFVVVALTILLLYPSQLWNGLSISNRMSGQTSALVCLWIAIFGLCYGTKALNKALFPLLFLFFLVPLPDTALTSLIALLQGASAFLSEVILRILGVPVLRSGTVLSLPGVDLEVSPQCSGIRSSIALLILILIGSYLFLRSGWHRLVLVVAVLPVVIIKNAVRIVSLSLLSVYVDPSFLSGSLHRSGGGLFFVIGLVILMPILVFFARTERRLNSTTCISRTNP
ncbi:MAG TPA: exosortase/archaeosortase family protein, partial [Candidatus Bathyarchaeia archaeon]|nr:exosortase/archaeosortase family protein [Candidatus Bathyarchaeia archaeon]